MNVPPNSFAPAPNPADLRWAALAEAETLGEPLSPHDLAFLRSYVPTDPALRAQQALQAALAGWGEGPLPHEDDEAVLAAAVSAHVHEATGSGRTRGPWLAAGGLAAAAAVVLGVLAWPALQPPSGMGSGAGSEADGVAQVHAPAAGEATDEADALAHAPETTGDDAHLRSLSGTWVDDQGTPLLGAATPGTVLTASSRACLGHGASGRVCVEPGARVRAVEADGPALEWLGGSGELTTPSTPDAVVLELRVAGVRVSGAGATVAVETTVDGRWSLAVRQGHVRLQTAEGTRSLTAGERYMLAELDEPGATEGDDGSSPRGAGPDAATLLQRARTARAEGAMADAAAHYRRLLRAHPRSPLAGPAWVALGQVELSRGRARAALEAFDRYLKRGGPLAEEAAYGRIEALRALGRKADEQAAIERFLARYPGSSYAAKLRRR